MNQQQQNPTHVAVQVGPWKAIIDFLMEKHPMKEVEGMVNAMRQGIPCSPQLQQGNGALNPAGHTEAPPQQPVPNGE